MQLTVSNLTKQITSRRELVLLAAGFVAVVLIYRYSATNSTRLEAASQTLTECRRLASSIRAAQQSPQRARLDSRPADDLGTAVEEAAAQAKIPREHVIRIDPQAPRRLGKTDYLEQATEAELVGVSVEQLVSFLYALQDRDRQLQIGTLRLRAPHDASATADREMWLADVVLTQRIYAPTTAER